MITLLLGENSFEVQRALRAIITDFSGASERFDGTELSRTILPNILMGVSLFADKRLVIIRGLSEQKTLWAEFGNWLPRISDDIHLVLVEASPDKRTKTFKELQKVAVVSEYKLWGERDVGPAQSWVITEAQNQGVILNKKCAQLLVQRIGVDQWQLYQSLQKLKVLGDITPATIEEFIEPNPTENIFNLFASALRGDGDRVRTMVSTFELADDPYRLFGLLSGQVFQLSALVLSDKPMPEVAKDIAAHPFALGKLAPYARRMRRSDVKKIIGAFAEADQAIKTSAAEPWLLIERALVKVAALRI